MKSFQKLYDSNAWNNNCSNAKQSEKITPTGKFYTNLIKDIIYKSPEIKNILEVGCGTFSEIRFIDYIFDMGLINYTGVDIVKDNIVRNNLKNNKEFIKFKYLEDVFQVGFDLVIIKDVIQHYNTDEAISMLEELIKNNKYVLCVNGYKFQRDLTKNNWKERILDKKYRYHPISSDKELKVFEEYEISKQTYKAKEYILYKLFD